MPWSELFSEILEIRNIKCFLYKFIKLLLVPDVKHKTNTFNIFLVLLYISCFPCTFSSFKLISNSALFHALMWTFICSKMAAHKTNITTYLMTWMQTYNAKENRSATLASSILFWCSYNLKQFPMKFVAKIEKSHRGKQIHPFCTGRTNKTIPHASALLTRCYQNVLNWYRAFIRVSTLPKQPQD